MNTLTPNTNLLGKVRFKLIINSHEFANTQYFCVSATLPSISCQAAPSPFRNQKGFQPGETIEYDTLQLRISLDEDMAAYTEIYNWMKSFVDTTDLKRSDVTLVILTSHNNPNKSFVFKNAFPTNLGSIDFNVQDSEVEYAVVDVTFQYDYFTFESIPALNCEG